MAKKKEKPNYRNFKLIKRIPIQYRTVEERLHDYKDLHVNYTDEDIQLQASRCQDCGIPFCHGYGCPVSNLIPDWNDLVYKGKWEEACRLLHSTNNFPEVTGRVCPAPCEESCTLNVGLESVTIRDIEMTIVEKGFTNGWIISNPPLERTGKKVAIIGSGPAGLAAAQQLNRMGHSVTLFEKAPKAGGFLRYGIPDYKLEKWVLDRRIKQMTDEGVVIKTNTYVGKDITVDALHKDFDAIVLACGAREARDIQITGRELSGIYQAVDYLTQSNERVDGISFDKSALIDAKGKSVLVIGGGDTGADCVGTSRRQGATSVTQIEILPKPPEKRSEETPWPQYAKKLRTSTSHDEGCERKWCITTKKIEGTNGKIEKVLAAEVEWVKNEKGNWDMKEVAGSEFEIKADLIFLAMGFVHPVHDQLVKELGIDLDPRGNFKTNNFGYGATSVNKVFSVGDCARGASLVVWAIANGRAVADMVNEYLLK
ncbi:MAG TPA: glutamate synthase [Spirochaetia bacterium]|nr:glutamate synthase [Spirochaetia bacterium]